MTRTAIALLCISGCMLMSFKGSKEEPVDYVTIAKIKNEGFNNSKVMETLFQITDANGPRLTGSAGMKRAEAWTAKQLKEWGLSNVAIEPWGTFGKGWENKKSYTALTTPFYMPLIGVPKAWTGSTKGLINGQAILVHVTEEKDMAQYAGKLKGKIVVVTPADLEIKPGFSADAKRLTDEELDKICIDPRLEDMPAIRRRSNYAAQRAAAMKWRRKVDSFYAAEQAMAVISCRRGTMGTVFTSNGAAFEADVPVPLPELEVSSEHIAHIIRLVQHNIPVNIEMDIQNTINLDDPTEYNVVAEIPGTDKQLKSEVVMLGGHLDSWHGATGATDNAAGAAVMMEAIRILKELNIQPRRTIRLILWSGEEQGLLGSIGYVSKHFGDSAIKHEPEYAHAAAYFNLDNGQGKIRGIYAQSNDEVKPVFEAWMAPFKDLGANTVTIRNTGSTDHIAFDEIGIPGFQFLQDPLDYGTRAHHTNMDTYDRIVPNDLMQASIIVASFVYHTAMRDEKLPRKP